MRDDVYVEFIDVPISSIIAKPDWNAAFAQLSNVSPDMPVRGKVLAVGPQQWDVQCGDVIQFHFAGVEYQKEGRAIVKSKYIEAVLDACEV
jgi:hypothetical protein